MKRFSIDCLLALCVATVFFCSTAYATEVALTGDAHVNVSRSSTNFGTLANLYVGNGNTALLQFDLSTLPSGLTASQISRATLTLFINRVNNGGMVNLSPVTSAWSESAVTDQTLPTIGTAVNSFTAAAAGQYVTLDVTSLVQGWVTTPASNNGFALTSSVADVLLDSKENDETGHAAKLDITITSTGATGATGAQGIQGPIGPQGIQGLTGATGAMGAQGIQGAIGATGATGATGAAGAAGATGAAGAAGITYRNIWSSSMIYQINDAVSFNSSSYIAIAGNFNVVPGSDPTVWTVLAAAGSTGATGAAGATGPQGIQGPIGATGPAGPQGNTGAAGPQGATGATGATGTIGPVTDWNTTTTYSLGQVIYCPASGACNSADQGSSYISLIGNNLNQDPSNAAAWQQIAKAGAAGSNGATGPTGATGATGPAGPTGATGATGPAGSGSSPSASTFSGGIPFTVVSHGSTNPSTYIYASPLSGGGSGNILNFIYYAVMPTACHAYLSVASPSSVTYALTSSTSIGGSSTSLGSCSTSSSSMTCSIDGGNVSAGSLISITLSSSVTSAVVYTTAFSCQ